MSPKTVHRKFVNNINMLSVLTCFYFVRHFRTMASHISETIFQVVSSGSVNDLKRIVAVNGLEVVAQTVNSLNSKGETPLLLAIKRQIFQMVKFLVDDLQADIGQLGLVWNGLNCMKVLPLFAAILYDSSPNHRIINFLMRKDAADESSVVLNSLKSSNIPLQDKIDLLKLVGAAYVLRADEDEDARFTFGKKCWFDAMALTSKSTAEIARQLSKWANIFGNVPEFTTLEELEESVGNQLKIQAFLIMERIGSRNHPGPNPFFLLRLFDHLYLLRTIPNARSSLDNLMLLLEEFRVGEWQVAINSQWANDFVAQISYQICLFFTNSRDLPAHHPRRFSRFMDVFRCYSDLHLKCLQHPISRVSDTAKGICEWITNFFAHMPPLNPEETQEFEKWLSQYIREVNCHSGVRTPLHAACRFYYPIALIRLLLGAGADPSTADENGWAPLHFLFQPISPWHREISACVHMLLDAGAHMDQLNSQGKTALDFCKSLQSNQEGCPDPQLDTIVKNCTPFSLSCFSAQVIVLNRIPFQEALPPKLQTFVKLHGGKM